MAVIAPGPVRPAAGTVAPGVGVALVVALVASVVGGAIPILGAAVCAIVLGLAFSLASGARPRLLPGYRFCSRAVLKASIVLLGTGLSFTQVGEVGRGTLPVLVPTLAVGLVGSVVLGRLLGMHGAVRTLVGVGTSICGASAIAATSAVIDAEEEDVAPAIWTIFVFNVVAVATFPVLGHLLDLSQSAFGVWAGTAVNDTSSVTAAAYAYGERAGDDAVVVKLTRTLAIVPICLALAWHRGRHRRNEGRSRRPGAIPWSQVMPLFLVGFVIAVGLNTAGAVPAAWADGLGATARFAMVVALAGVGLSVDAAGLRRTGWRALALGGVLWIALAGVALVLVLARGG